MVNTAMKFKNEIIKILNQIFTNCVRFSSEIDAASTTFDEREFQTGIVRRAEKYCLTFNINIGCCGRIGRGASLYRHRSQLFGRCGLDSHCRSGSFLRFNSRPIMYGAVGSLVLSWSWIRQPGFISFWCLWIQLCNNLGQRLCAYNLP